MKKEYVSPSMMAISIGVMALSVISEDVKLDTNPQNPNYAPGYGGKGRGRYAEDDLDEEEEEF